jgi:hypothetical protein
VTGGYWSALRWSAGELADAGRFHVRWTPRPDGCLILHEDDPDATFVLVTGRVPDLVICGAVPASVGRDRRYWRSDVPYPAFFVPQSVLISLGRS